MYTVSFMMLLVLLSMVIAAIAVVVVVLRKPKGRGFPVQKPPEEQP